MVKIRSVIKILDTDI